MYPSRFRYEAPTSVDEAIRLLASNDDAKVLAGGQSLLPTMALRLGPPEHIIDIGRLPGLDAISVGADGVTIGALVRHAAAERSADIAANAPLSVRHTKTILRRFLAAPELSPASLREVAALREECFRSDDFRRRAARLAGKGRAGESSTRPDP